jgi:hypothetical protein
MNFLIISANSSGSSTASPSHNKYGRAQASVKLKACIPDLLTTLERALVGKIDFFHYPRILVRQDVHFTLEIRQEKMQ